MRPRMSKSASRMSALSAGEQELVEWVNSRLPATCPLAEDLSTSMSSGLILFRLAESIKEVDPGVSDSVFPQGPGDELLHGLFKLFDFLLDNDVRMGAVSINDLRNGNAERLPNSSVRSRAGTRSAGRVARPSRTLPLGRGWV
ncbi:hypothetical protein RSOLAG22IIIB_12110 [Rhizoctonia solani]|uniref:Uncharacterized protein n=1 Tax=Rhizoctonia solani TaxID=456999 RepID=A0A0K6GCU3_9AGAM|nr:hypothetical protein RSOLAG22IIIB_12110 [Rhizoctonia solani]